MNNKALIFVFAAGLLILAGAAVFLILKLVNPTAIGEIEIVNKFSRGLAETEDVEVAIPEGTNLADLVRIMEKTGLFRAREILNKDNLVYEGFLFPDTYRFAADEEPNAILNKMLSNFSIKTAEFFNARDLMSSYNKRILVIASLLEKEVRTEEAMRLVAGIIEKRLERRMPLEIDATVGYGVCYPEFQRGNYCDVSKVNIIDNLKGDSVYNTYVIKGLPPAPIVNPGLKAIQAALLPEASDYLYYLSAKDGTTIFSKTAAEHLANRKKYLNL